MKTFKTDNVIIRRFQMRDAEQLNLLLYNDSNVAPEYDNDINEEDRIENLNKTKLVIKSAINEYYTDEPVWAVENKWSKKIIGYIRVCNYSIKNKMCNISWVVSNEHWDDGFMKDAFTKIFNFLFTKKNIELIECSYYQQDNNSNVILDEIGMTREAVLRDRRVNEKTHKKENFVIYSISKEEFFNSENYKLSSRKSIKRLKRKI